MTSSTAAGSFTVTRGGANGHVPEHSTITSTPKDGLTPLSDMYCCSSALKAAMRLMSETMRVAFMVNSEPWIDLSLLISASSASSPSDVPVMKRLASSRV